MARLAIFIDAGYINALAEKEFGIWVDYSKFSNYVLSVVGAQTSEPIDLLRTYYYDCLPYQSDPPTQQESERLSRYRGFRDFLSRLPRFVIREGRLKYRGLNQNGQPIFQQKRVDLMLGLDFSLLSAKHQISHIAIIAGDSDLLPALEVAKNEGIMVWLFHGPKISKIDKTCTYAVELWEAADERCEINQNFMEQVKYNKSKVK